MLKLFEWQNGIIYWKPFVAYCNRFVQSSTDDKDEVGSDNAAVSAGKGYFDGEVGREQNFAWEW